MYNRYLFEIVRSGQRSRAFKKAKQYARNLMPQSYKTQIKIQPYPGLA